MLWFPDIIISEIMDGETPDTPYVYLDNKGHVYDDRTRRVVTSCQLTIFYFPFDVQNCSLTFGSFLHTASDIQISAGLTSEEILQGSREVMYTVGEWKLADIRHAQNVLDFEGSRYSELKYYVILRRRPIRYVVNLLVPSIFMVTVDLLSFLLPPQSVDRSSFKMTLILGYTVFLLIMNDLLPVTGNTIPLINVFFSITLALMVASLLETVLITNIQSHGQYRAVPRWLRVLLLQYGASLVCLPRQCEVIKVTVSLPQQTAKDLQLSSQKKDPSGSVQDSTLCELLRDVSAIRRQVDAHTRGTDVNKEWHLLGLVLDRLLFGLYILFITVSFITIGCIWTFNSEN
uniref:Uncharacterized protein n=1 Tax=Knipowitschia caucasica TaxID=637954 RepID=A0AAV2KU03_KNICA